MWFLSVYKILRGGVGCSSFLRTRQYPFSSSQTSSVIRQGSRLYLSDFCSPGGASEACLSGVCRSLGDFSFFQAPSAITSGSESEAAAVDFRVSSMSRKVLDIDMARRSQKFRYFCCRTASSYLKHSLFTMSLQSTIHYQSIGSISIDPELFTSSSTPWV
jgi:hypothetical protein